MERKELITLLHGYRDQLTRAGVKSLAIFGSVARGEQRPQSDIDFLVEFDRPVGLFEFIHLKLELEKWTGRTVDLVTKDALRAEMRTQILEEAMFTNILVRVCPLSGEPLSTT